MLIWDCVHVHVCSHHSIWCRTVKWCKILATKKPRFLYFLRQKVDRRLKYLRNIRSNMRKTEQKKEDKVFVCPFVQVFQRTKIDQDIICILIDFPRNKLWLQAVICTEQHWAAQQENTDSVTLLHPGHHGLFVLFFCLFCSSHPKMC